MEQLPEYRFDYLPDRYSSDSNSTNSSSIPKTPVLPTQYQYIPLSPLSPQSIPPTNINSSSSSRTGSYSSISSSVSNLSTFHNPSSTISLPSLPSPTYYYQNNNNSKHTMTAPLQIPPRKPSHHFRLLPEHNNIPIIPIASKLRQHSVPTLPSFQNLPIRHASSPPLDLNIRENIITLTIDTNQSAKNSDLDPCPSPRDRRLKRLDTALHSIMSARSLLNNISDHQLETS